MEKKMRKQNLVEPVEEEVLMDNNQVPPYPTNEKNGTTQFTDGEPAQTAPVEEPNIEVDTKQLSYDLVEMGGKIWHLVNPKVREFEKPEIRNIAEPLAAVIVKHDLTKYMKYLGYTQEILLVYNTISVVNVRMKELKEPVNVIKEDFNA